MQNLGERLSLAASFVKADSSVCDVGCDHAYLSAFLYMRGDLKSVMATDINERPLENARQTLNKYGIENGIKLVLTDGLSGVTREMADTVIIMGLGGEVISGIIDRAAFLRDNSVSLILSPMTDVPALREYLAQNGFAVETEKAVTENKKVYSVMLVRYDGKIRELSPVKLRIGEIKNENEASVVYIKRQIKLLQKYLFNIRQTNNMEKEILKTEETVLELKKILGE